MRSRTEILTGVARLTAVLCAVAPGCAWTAKAVTPPAKSPARVSGQGTHPNGRPELVLQYSHGDRPLDVAFAARAPVFASSHEDGSIDIWDTRTWELRRTIDTDTRVTSRNFNTRGIAFSPDGKTLANLTDSGEVQIWDTGSGSRVKNLPEPLGLPVSVTWSPDGRRIAAGSTDAVRIWDVASGKVLRSFAATGDVAFSSNGKILGTAGENDAFLFDIASRRKIRSFSDKAGVSWPVAISPDGRYVATGGEDPGWDPGPLPRDEDGNEYPPTESFYAHRLKVKIWDALTGKRVRMLPGNSNLGGGTQVLQFTPEGRRLFSGGEGYAALWDTKTGVAVRSFDTSGSSALSSDGKLVAIAGGPLAVFSAATGKRTARMHAAPLPIVSLAFSPDGEMLAAGDQGASSTNLRLWDVGNGRLTRAVVGPPPDLHDVGFLSGHRVFSNSMNGTYIWDSATGKLLAKHQGPKGASFMDNGSPLWQLLTPDGSRLVHESTGGSPKSYVFRSISTGRPHTTISPKRGNTLGDAAFSPDGRYFAIRTIANPGKPTVEIWDIQTGKRVAEINDTGAGAVLLFFSPDGKMIAGSLPSPVQMPEGKLATDNRIVIWDTESGKARGQLILGKEAARTLAFSPDGRTIAAGIGAGIQLYSAETTRKIGAMTAGKSPVSALAFSPDGSRIAAGHEDGRVSLWDAGARKLVVTLLGFTSADGKALSQDWLACTPDGRYDWSPGATALIRWRYQGKLFPAGTFARELRREKTLR